MRKIKISITLSVLVILVGCGITKEGGGFNLFTPEQDMQLGEEVNKQIQVGSRLSFPYYRRAEMKNYTVMCATLPIRS